jgi:hypothetical protein
MQDETVLLTGDFAELESILTVKQMPTGTDWISRRQVKKNICILEF